ncbi:hypothetical protein [Gimesia aquarii]|uniref:Xylosidase/arabinosidase n=1 Tax=Gimesia aquarii TaxID=2527964 RepID=A0A517WN67_9PLAN|nr:hypothetical protein [Gimesia aquarii]QDU06673.1 hypothetical protein V202x_00160 [Gimesia aquarii]
MIRNPLIFTLLSIITSVFCLHPALAQTEAASAPVDCSTLTGKVMVGYQGWFNCADDGANLGWKHWARNRRKPFAPGNVTVDLWPDVSELDPDERFATGFKHADGSTAEVFSSANRKTVQRHFRWMRDYGIDGAFLQRFASGLSAPALLRNNNTVLSHVRAGANQSGRAFAVMYDLSGLKAGQVKRVREDWTRLCEQEKITGDTTYLHHEGKPLVAVWGIGFSDNRPYSLGECFELVKWLKSSGCTVMLGVPSFWREGTRDAVNDPLLHEIIQAADVISPWTIGRYRSPQEATRHATRVWQPDQRWCEQRELDFLPVVFPGFSWHNLHGGKLNQIPRLKGEFFWSQVSAAKRVGCKMIYVAMFDEVDEGTAIFKCTNTPPTANGAQFSTFEGLPSDHYLKLAGRAGTLLKDKSVSKAHANKSPGHRLLIGYGEGLMELDQANNIVWHYQDPEIELVYDAWKLENGNILFSHRFGVREVNPAKQTVWDFKVPREKGKQEINSCQPLEDGKVLILDCGNQRLLEVNRGQQVTLAIDLPDGGKNPHNRYMQARKTPQDTYLISYRDNKKILELNAKGKIIWQYALQENDRPFTAIRLENGRTLVPCITSYRIIEIDPEGKITWELNTKDDLGFQLLYPVGVHVRKNGNLVVINSDYHHKKGMNNDVQAFEINRQKQVLWTLTKADLEKNGKVPVVERGTKMPSHHLLSIQVLGEPLELK